MYCKYFTISPMKRRAETIAKIKLLYFTPSVQKNQYLFVNFKKEQFKMAEATAQEQLLNFIHDLTDEECDFLILLLQKREQA